MAKYDPTHPALCIRGTIDQAGTTAISQYSENDETGLFGVNISYEMTIDIPDYQIVKDESLRSKNQYTGLDIKTGDYITETLGEQVLKITKIISKSDGQVTLEATDIDAISYRQYGKNQLGGNLDIIVFELSENGNAVFAGSNVSFFKSGAIDKIQSRFSIDEHDERFRFNQLQPANVDVGDIVTVDDSGNIVLQGTVGAATTPVGNVVSTARNKKTIYVKPFNKIIENYSDPSVLTGSPGDTYYTDTNNPGKITTQKEPGAKSVYLHLKDAIPTEIESTSSTALPQPDHLVKINNITVFDGGIGHQVLTVTAFKSMINAQSSATKVTASADIADIFIETNESYLHGSINEMVSLVSGDGGNNYVYPTATFGDGNNTVQITFNPFNYSLSPTAFNGLAQYLVITATEIADILNAEFTQNGINLEASAYSVTGKNYPFLRIDGQNGADILITNVSPDAFGTSFAGSVGSGTATGLELTTNIGSNAFLKLTRADGGDILITGGKYINGSLFEGGFINTNGFCSSSSGSPALIMMIEGSSDGGGNSDVGVNVVEDKDMTPSVTSGDNSPTGLYISYTPFLDSSVNVKLNGIDANLGGASNYQTKSCYFSPDGFIVRNIEDIESGDELYWNGNVVGFELDATDDIDFLYQTSASNI